MFFLALATAFFLFCLKNLVLVKLLENKYTSFMVDSDPTQRGLNMTGSATMNLAGYLQATTEDGLC